MTMNTSLRNFSCVTDYYMKHNFNLVSNTRWRHWTENPGGRSCKEVFSYTDLWKDNPNPNENTFYGQVMRFSKDHLNQKDRLRIEDMLIERQGYAKDIRLQIAKHIGQLADDAANSKSVARKIIDALKGFILDSDIVHTGNIKDMTQTTAGIASFSVILNTIGLLFKSISLKKLPLRVFMMSHGAVGLSGLLKAVTASTAGVLVGALEFLAGLLLVGLLVGNLEVLYDKEFNEYADVRRSLRNLRRIEKEIIDFLSMHYVDEFGNHQTLHIDNLKTTKDSLFEALKSVSPTDLNKQGFYLKGLAPADFSEILG